MKKNRRSNNNTNKRNYTQPMTIGQRFTMAEIEAMKKKIKNTKGKSK